ncbi:hypothetical protein [uncultured Methanobrevibacter sp.]|uniref:hypothetical protein n=1 Tax=uncultured Methanobrevibacter sp. TaxID=253161 RepID=UPI0025FBD20B|nr:hypothetical protein [uncultured Methanobrevibacter sp.]
MFFNTIKEYDEELKDIEDMLNDMEKRIELYPDRVLTKGNYRTLKEIYNIILNDKNDFLAMMEESINLHISGDEVKNHNISLPIIMGLFGNFQDLTTLLSNFLKDSRNYAFESHDLKLEEVSSGSIQILFSMDENITNLEEVYLNHQVFEKLLDLVDCNIDDLDKQIDVIGTDSLMAYKKFLKILIDNELDFTLENNSRKVGLTHEEALKVYKKIDDGI